MISWPTHSWGCSFDLVHGLKASGVRPSRGWQGVGGFIQFATAPMVQGSILLSWQALTVLKPYVKAMARAKALQRSRNVSTGFSAHTPWGASKLAYSMGTTSHATHQLDVKQNRVGNWGRHAAQPDHSMIESLPIEHGAASKASDIASDDNVVPTTRGVRCAETFIACTALEKHVAGPGFGARTGSLPSARVT